MGYTGRLVPITIVSAPLAGAPLNVARRPISGSSGDVSEFGGAGQISGTVKNLGTPDFPVWRRVRLFHLRTGMLIRETWSDPVTGAYTFTRLNPLHKFTAIAYDHTGQYNAVVSDDLTPEVMP